MKQRDRTLLRVLGIAVGITEVGLRARKIWRKQRDLGEDNIRTISVVGFGVINAPPDQARVHLGVQTRSMSAQEASTQNAQVMQVVLAALKEQGIEEKHVQTTQFSLNPEFQHRPDGTSITKGYTASNNLHVTITSIDHVGAVIDAAIAAAGDNIAIHQVEFNISNAVIMYEQARIAALADARRQAHLIAQEMDLSLGKALKIQTGSSNGHRPPPARMLMRAHTSVEPGEIDVTVAIEVVFEALVQGRNVAQRLKAPDLP